MKNKHALTVLTVAVALYHLAALVKDAERWAFNARRVRAQPSVENLAGLLLASGILIADFRSL